MKNSLLFSFFLGALTLAGSLASADAISISCRPNLDPKVDAKDVVGFGSSSLESTDRSDWNLEYKGRDLSKNADAKLFVIKSKDGGIARYIVKSEAKTFTFSNLGACFEGDPDQFAHVHVTSEAKTLESLDCSCDVD